ncbi:hypothetical protein [Desulfovibrio sp.]|uniref:hypothetical protein n=1 Tax=Desulfovibrio sp. TaxID=885 RepID=UPI0025BED343|nr:hypothetical protein [Desulfovibrio sp.]
MSEWVNIVNLLMTVATCVMAWATWLMAKVTKKTLEAQWKPYISVYAQTRPDTPNALQIVIENIGSAPAYNIKFKKSSNLLYNAWGITPNDNRKGLEITKGPLITGIPYLPPKGKRVIHWGQYGGILSSLEGEPAEVTAIFCDSHGNQEPPAKSILDIKDFENTAAIDSLELRQVRALEKIPKQLDKICSTLGKKFRSQAPENAFMWACIAIELGFPQEIVLQQGCQDGLSEEQRNSAIDKAHFLLKNIRPEQTYDNEKFNFLA